MKIEKKKLIDLPAVYVTGEVMLKDKRYYVAASENPGEHAYIFDTENNKYADLWLGDTGCMNVIQIPNSDKMLAITKFYPIFQSKEAEICLLSPNGDNYLSPWKKETVLKVPFVHRIGTFQAKGKNYLLICTLCLDKEYTDDWSKPGAIYISPINEEGGEWPLVKVVDGLLKNHGLWIENNTKLYTTSENGILLWDLANYEYGNEVKPTLLAGFPTSDISTSDKYYATIEPFHGDKGVLYNWNYEKVKEYEINFGHVVWLGKILGREVVIFGSRGGNKNLEMFDIENGKKTVIDTMVGPTQITVVSLKDKVEILSANHGAGTVYLYTIS